MKNVNLRIPKTFGQRTNTEVKLPKKKYFLVVEGQTETQYFYGLHNYKRELGINDLVEIILLEREEENKSDSHPLHLLNGILKRTGEVYVSDDYEVLEYDREIDEIWLIFDRDPGNLSPDQLEDIFQTCNQKSYYMGMTNPCFEFWLLLHLPNIQEYNPSELLKNKRTPRRSKKRFIDKELSNRLYGYNKKCLRFIAFKGGIDLAIEQEKLFTQTIPELFSELGSNIGVMISKMRSGN